MEISAVGTNGVRIKTKNAVINIENGVVTLGGDKPFKIDTPGEYEVGGVSVIGVNDAGGAKIYVVEVDGLRLAYMGKLAVKLTNIQIEDMGSIDILILPIHNSEIVSQIDPWVVLTENSQDGLASVPKYLITADKLPTELATIVLDLPAGRQEERK